MPEKKSVKASDLYRKAQEAVEANNKEATASEELPEEPEVKSRTKLSPAETSKRRRLRKQIRQQKKQMRRRRKSS